jgi:hypothetical protein
MSTSKAIRDFLAMIGRKGGKASRKNLSVAERRRLAQNAVRVRWARAKGKRKRGTP